jgi:hypothetical protein
VTNNFENFWFLGGSKQGLKKMPPGFMVNTWELIAFLKRPESIFSRYGRFHAVLPSLGIHTAQGLGLSASASCIRPALPEPCKNRFCDVISDDEASGTSSCFFYI